MEARLAFPITQVTRDLGKKLWLILRKALTALGYEFMNRVGSSRGLRLNVARSRALSLIRVRGTDVMLYLSFLSLFGFWVPLE